ncbi:MAG: hypothetical protein WCF99_06575 [Chloroflexales bacterium]
MARPNLPKISAGTLRIPDAQPSAIIALDSSAWFTWLDHADRFAYTAETASFTARKQSRRGNPYWYAYKRRAGTLRCIYLGRSAELTGERLCAAAGQFELPASVAPLDITTVAQQLTTLRTLHLRGAGAEAVKLADQLYQALVAERQWATNELAAIQRQTRIVEDHGRLHDRPAHSGEVF